MLASDDNVGFLGNVDCALLIAAAESTTLSNIDLCEKELAQLTNVLGVVLNKCRYPDDSVGYAYGSYA
jgi:BioD-like phosphotransacetylase family protein